MSTLLESLLTDEQRQAAQAAEAPAGFDPTIKAVVSPAIQSAIEARRAEYRAALGRHDWTYQCSQDPAVYAAGVAERNRLNTDAESLDPDRRIWNAVAPAEFRVRGGAL